MDADKPLGPRQPLAQLFERDARRVAGEDRARLHLRLDAGEDFALEFEIFRHRLDNQVGAGNAVALEIGDKAIERIAHSAALVAADLAVKLGGALDRPADRILVGVAERDDKAVPGAPGGDVAAHGAGADHVHATSVPLAAGEVFQIIPQIKDAHQVLRGIADQELGEGRDLRLLHGFRIAAVLDPQIDQDIRCRIMRARRSLGGFACHARGQQVARRLRVQERADEVLLCPFHLAANGSTHRAAHVALLRHRINQMQRPCPAGAFAAAGQHHGHRLQWIDQPRQPHRATEAGMQAKLHFGKTKARVIDGDSVVAGERHFQPAAEAIAVNDRDRDRRQPVEPVEYGVAARQRCLDLRRIGDATKLRDVGAGDEAGRFGGPDDDARRRLAFEFFQDRVEFGQHVFRQRIGAGVFFVEQEPDGAVLVGAHAPMRVRARVPAALLPSRTGRARGCACREWRVPVWRVARLFMRGPVKSLRSAWRRLGRRRCIRWRCRASCRAASWR